MKFRSINDIYEIVPPILFDGISNRDLPAEEQFIIRVKGLSITDLERIENEATLDVNRFEPVRRVEEQRKRMYDLLRSKVAGISGYQLADGREVTTFDELVAEGCPEVIKWLFSVVSSGERLSAAARKNSLPGSDSPSSYLTPAAPPTIATPATNGSEPVATVTTATV